jgi:hypothetical protein
MCLAVQDHNIRPGWLTLGKDLTSSNFDKETYTSYFAGANGHLLGTTDRIEALRPKSPPRCRPHARSAVLCQLCVCWWRTVGLGLSAARRRGAGGGDRRRGGRGGHGRGKHPR